jgi:hypothetical protein
MTATSQSASARSAVDEVLREAPSVPASHKVRAWEVVHACEFARDIADVVEAQIEAGMRPYLLTVGADVAPKASVLQAWQDVRRWRKALDDSGAHTTPDLIHAHCFSAGMAAVRMGACLVYDLRQAIELRLSANGDSPGAWATRSFRTAEQFVLSKAAAVVVHNPLLREDCIARGVSPENVFVVADPLPFNERELAEEYPEMSEADRERLRETRSPKRIAERYDEIYRYAYLRRRKGDGSADSSGTLIPIPANL